MTVKEIIQNENHGREFNSPFGNVSVGPEKNLYASLRKKICCAGAEINGAVFRVL